MGLGGLGWRQKSVEGSGPKSQDKQVPVTTHRVASYPPTWEKPTEAVLVRIVHPLADPEDGDAGRVLGLLWDRNRQRQPVRTSLFPSDLLRWPTPGNSVQRPGTPKESRVRPLLSSSLDRQH